jgi:hypothetical protein
MLITNTIMMLNLQVICGNSPKSVWEIICLNTNRELNCVIMNLALLHVLIIQYLMYKVCFIRLIALIILFDL